MEVEKLTDKELAELSAKLKKEADQREAIAEHIQSTKQAQRSETIRRFLNMEDGALLNAFAPEHNASRYGNEDCTDNNPHGHERPFGNPKEFGCRRCVLIAVANGDFAPDEVIDAFY